MLRRNAPQADATEAWATEEAARLLADDDVAGLYGIGEPLHGVHPAVEAEVARMWRELEADDARS